MAVPAPAGPPAAATGCDTRHIEFRYADGARRTLDVDAGRPILDAALAADIPLLHQCRSGSCSSCVARLVQGETRQHAGGRSALLRSEHEAGLRLLCQAEAAADCVFDLDYDSAAGAGRPRKASAFVDRVERVASNVVRLRLELAADHWVDFQPGQFFQLRIPGTDIVRSYSPASTSAALPALEFLIRLLPGGAMSQWLVESAQVDDVVEIEGAFGAFFLRDKVRAPHIFVAGGTGLAPILSMLDALRAQPGRKPPALLSFGCTDPAALFGLDEIALRRTWMPNLQARISVDRDAEGDLLLGTPVAALSQADVGHPDTIAYLCGPPPMVEAARARLEAFGVRPANILAEQFVASTASGEAA